MIEYLNFSENLESLSVLKDSIYSIASSLKKDPRVFVIGVGGGNDVWGAIVGGAREIKGVELNQPTLDIHKEILPDYSSYIINNPKVKLICAEGRSFLMQDRDKYDVIQMTGVDTWTSLTSGAYVLAENYLYTSEALNTMYQKLNEGGILSITRFDLDEVTLRLISSFIEGIPEDRKSRLKSSILCFSSKYLRTVLIKKGEFSDKELNEYNVFLKKGFRSVYHPKRTYGNVVEQFIRTEDKESFIKSYPKNISPATDDRPYFFNFFKWSRFFTSASQGYPFIIFFQLFTAIVLASLLILFPIVKIRKKTELLFTVRFFIYFSGLGLGFILLEISLMQKLVLFLGHPLYSVAVTLFSILIFSGMGSIYSNRLYRFSRLIKWLVPVGLLFYMAAFILLSNKLFHVWIGYPQAVRIFLAITVLAPVSFLIGIPFAYGINLLNRLNPSIIPWAWAINGFMTVFGSILSVILSMHLGFNFVMILAVTIYFVSFTAINMIKSKE